MTADPAPGERMTVILVPKAAGELRRLQERTHMSATDLANRAIILYEFFDAQQRAGREMIARDKRTGARRLVRLSDPQARRLASASPTQPTQGHAGSAHQRSHRRRQHSVTGSPSRPLPLAGFMGQEVSTT